MKSNVQCEECYKYFYDESDCLHHQCSGIHWWMISDYEDSFEFKSIIYYLNYLNAEIVIYVMIILKI